jgi:hypothetical protein
MAEMNFPHLRRSLVAGGASFEFFEKANGWDSLMRF